MFKKSWQEKLKKINAGIICLGLILGSISLVPTVDAKTKYETLAYDKKLEKIEDFEKGEFENVKIEKDSDGLELSAKGEVGEYITPEIKAPFGATHIGLHWQENSSKENLVNVYLRVRNEGDEFGEWQKTSVELEDQPDQQKNKEIFAALIGVDNKEYAQAKIEFFSQDGKTPKLKNFTFTFLNSGEISKKIERELSLAPTSSAETGSVLKVSPHGQSVNVVSREEWGANEDYRFDRKGKEEWPRSYHGTRKITVHHTAVASSNGVIDLEVNKAAVRSIYYYHAVTQGWGDIGYNALVDGAGNVYEGRYGTHDLARRNNPPTSDQVMVPDVEAGHTAGYNMGNFGVSAMGDFSNFDVPVAQREGLKKVLAYVADSRGINIQGNTDYRRYDSTWHNDLNNAIAHRDAVPTE